MRPLLFFFFSSRRRHTRCLSDWSSDVCSSDLTRVTRADAPKVLEYKWGGFDMRWELEDLVGGTRLTLWTNIGHRFISMGAAGWHICFDVLERLLAGQPIGRIVGPEAMKFGGWQRLNEEYAKQFGIETPNLPPWLGQSG